MFKHIKSFFNGPSLVPDMTDNEKNQAAGALHDAIINPIASQKGFDSLLDFVVGEVGDVSEELFQKN